MPDFELPEGRYFSYSGLIRASTGGKTRALLARNRLFMQRAGVVPTLLTFDQSPDYPEIRASLRQQGQLIDPMSLLNIYEWYRKSDIDHRAAVEPGLSELEHLDAEDHPHPDGTVYWTCYVHPRQRTEVIIDYRRPDGSVFLRVPTGPTITKNPATDVILANSSSQPVARWSTFKEWRHDWLRTLSPDERTFIISDTFSVVNILPMPDPRFFVLYLMHNTHLTGSQRWNSAVSPAYRKVLDSIQDLDGLVNLTDRQRQDISERFGSTNNLFVVPNPVEFPARSESAVREPKHFAMVTRLEPQKGVEHAVRAFALVLDAEPDARLDIYGDGSRRESLEKEIADLGVQGSVVLRGHDPEARRTLQTATGFLLSSRFEGYPLATLESMSFGCPVIAYDVKYGLREQITDGVDGYLVPPGDIRAMADRVLQMIHDPSLSARMSEAAFEKARAHNSISFLKSWRRVLNEAVRNKDRRTVVKSVKLTVTQLGYQHGIAAPLQKVVRRLPDRLSILRVAAHVAGHLSASASFRMAPTIAFVGKLEVVGTSKIATLDEATITLDAVCASSGSVVPIPLRTRRSGDTFDVSSTVDVRRVFRSIEKRAYSVQLRLRFVWGNSSWETILARPKMWTANYESSFGPTGEMNLLRGPGAPR